MALSADRNTDRKEGQIQAYLVKSATTIYKGGHTMIDNTGYLIMAVAGGGTYTGVAIEGCVNPSGGALTARVYKSGTFKFAKTGTIVQADLGKPLSISDDQTCALGAPSLSTNLTGHTNNDLTFTATGIWAGRYGNDITIQYVDPGGTTASLTCSVYGAAIVISLARATSAISTIASDITSIIAATPAAAALVTVANKTGNDGTGLVEALAATRLSNGDYCGDLQALDGSSVWVRIDKAVA
jgi:hypothetical protein